MAQTADTSSEQNALLVNFTEAQTAGTLVTITDSAGETVVSFAPAKDFQSLSFSGAALQTGETYTIMLGGTNSGTADDGLYTSGTSTGGTTYESFTVSDVVTTVGTQQRGGWR